MNELCPSCREPLFDGVCVLCDVGESVELEAGPSDPLIGRVLADRYEISALHGTGGMARVYRAVQRSLEREVVVKVINPELLAQDELTADEAVARFFVEAQAASKLNHPNVVSVYDFGRTSQAEGGLLFLVMEYLTGRDLWTVHHEDLAMPFPRIANILQQTLAALGEAHYIGIAHRDIKPENIIIEPARGGRNLVKVIDFGLAKLGALQSVTKAGQTVGTPRYMAPEQIAGKALGSGDLYAVGVILFELLTGEVPFDGTPIDILRAHLGAPRPDPRDVAPEREIPAALANVCMRAMDIDPERRWPDAESLAEAIVRAAGASDWGSRAVLPGATMRPPPPPPPPSAPALTAPRPSAAPPAPSPVTIPRPPPRPSITTGRVTQPVPNRGSKPPFTMGGDPPYPPLVAPLVGRATDLAWAAKALATGRGGCLAIHGEAGTGRTRLLHEIAGAAEKRGARVVRARGPATPRREITYAGLRRIITALTGLSADDRTLATGEAAGRDLEAAAGLHTLFGGVFPHAPDEARAGAAAAFAWGARRAAERAPGAPAVLAVDDADQLDNASRRALVEGIGKVTAPSFFVLVTSIAPLDLPPARTTARALAGLGPADAALLLESLGGPRDAVFDRGSDAPVDSRRDGPASRSRPPALIEPLYVELIRRFRLDGAQSAAPPRLLDVVDAGLRVLPPPHRRLLLAAAMTGGGARAEVAALARRDDEARALEPLVEAGLLEVDAEEGLRVTHEVLAQVTLAIAPVGAVEALHVSAAEALADAPERRELRAYHALRGRPDFETFMLVEDCAALRSSAGDAEGAADLLWAGMRAGRTMLQHGEVEAGGSACVVFGQKLGAALRELGRYEETLSVLEEILPMTGPEDAARARTLEELSRAAGSLGRRTDAERWRREALAIARRSGDRALVQRLVALARE